MEDAGIISRRRRYHRGGTVGIQYTFDGDALVAATVEQNHPTLGPSISALAVGSGANTNLVSAEDERGPDAGANTNLVSAEDEQGPHAAANTNLVSAEDEQGPHAAANTNLVSAEVQDEDSRRAANTNLVSAQVGPTTREYQIGIRANTNLVPEPEVTEPEGVTVTDEFNQSNSGSSGSSDAREKKEPPPPWYRELAAALDPGRAPDLQAIEEQALLAGWSAAVLQSATRVYLRNYRSQRVTDPFALFRKLAVQEASRLPTAEPQRQGKYSDEHRRRRPQDT